MGNESSHKRKLAVKRDLILGRLTSNNWKEMGFDTVHKVLGDNGTDEQIHEIIQSFPSVLRSVRLRVRDEDGNILKDPSGDTLYKAGVGLVKVENA